MNSRKKYRLGETPKSKKKRGNIWSDTLTPGESVRGNSLSSHRESSSSRIIKRFFSWETIRDNFSVNIVVQTLFQV